MPAHVEPSVMGWGWRANHGMVLGLSSVSPQPVPLIQFCCSLGRHFPSLKIMLGKHPKTFSNIDKVNILSTNQPVLHLSGWGWLRDTGALGGGGRKLQGALSGSSFHFLESNWIRWNKLALTKMRNQELLIQVGWTYKPRLPCKSALLPRALRALVRTWTKMLSECQSQTRDPEAPTALLTAMLNADFLVAETSRLATFPFLS